MTPKVAVSVSRPAAPTVTPRAALPAAFLALMLVVQVAVAQGDAAQQTAPTPASQLEVLLAGVPSHPAVRSAQAALAAAEARLRAARNPISFNVSSSLTQLDVDEIDLDPLTPGVQPLEKTLIGFSAGVTFRPFVFGDIADLVDQREIAVAQARLDLAAAVVSLQVRTLEAGYELELAAGGVEVAEQGVALAQEALAATEVRAARGAASERDVREATNGLSEAENVLLDALANQELAELSLRSLWGAAEPATVAGAEIGESVAALPPPSGSAADVLRAGLQVRLAEIAPRGAQRALLPTAQAGYSFNLGDHDTLSLSIESRTLQPNVNFSHEAQGRSFPQTEIRGALQVGVAWSISPEIFNAIDAAEAQLEAARLGLVAARQGAELQSRALENSLAQAERAKTLAETRFADANARLTETRARVEAGIATPIELQSDALALTRAQLALDSARLNVLRSTLDLHELYAQPLTATPEANER